MKLASGLFGRLDAILIYEATDEEVAMGYLLDVCKLTGVVDSETFVATPILSEP